MRIAGEWYLCVNLLMNVACLCAASRLCARRLRAGRVMLSAWAGTLLSMAALRFWGLRASMYAVLPIGALMALLAFGVRGVPTGTLPLLWAALLSSGLSRFLLRMGFSLPAAALSCAPAVVYAAVMLLRWRSRAGERAELRVLFAQGGVTLDGLVDTGNLLRDPLTSLPVVVVAYGALRAYLPETLSCDDLSTLPQGYRFIGVRTASGTKLLMCFHPRALYVRKGSVWHAVEAMVAISPALHGHRALLPPTLDV